MMRMMRDRKVLVVLDDVDCIDHLVALAAHRVEFICDVSLLSDEESFCLFHRYAFGSEVPSPRYEDLSREVVCYATGLPLTIKVLGSSLCCKNELEWIDSLEQLKTIPLTETLKKLELSYISLDEDYNEIFLDTACNLKGWEKDNAIRALESCGFHARIGLRVLEQNSLITIICNSYGDELVYEFMACMIMLWKWVGILFVTQTPISLINIADCGKSMKLKIYWLMIWSLPTRFQANNLVTLEMDGSRMVQLWEGGQRKLTPNLETLNLQECKDLLEIHMTAGCLKLTSVDLEGSRLRTIDLGFAPNLERLILVECNNLENFTFPINA
ncbi:unnamed protein product [Lactuca saligna]|uniref:NB-ARC domain-containing protein n=1 Tax=Lactuca saligna TaxID=75948 RepID=A0AA35YYV3_LACSI|nr:unnamed protein product [Lactuca saligna]